MFSALVLVSAISITADPAGSLGQPETAKPPKARADEWCIYHSELDPENPGKYRWSANPAYCASSESMACGLITSHHQNWVKGDPMVNPPDRCYYIIKGPSGPVNCPIIGPVPTYILYQSAPPTTCQPLWAVPCVPATTVCQPTRRLGIFRR